MISTNSHNIDSATKTRRSVLGDTLFPFICFILLRMESGHIIKIIIIYVKLYIYKYIYLRQS